MKRGRSEGRVMKREMKGNERVRGRGMKREMKGMARGGCQCCTKQ